MLTELFLLILKAALIGVIISAPMGPVGVLVIQRTLNKGRHIGLATGVGAAVSDLVYCALTAFCLSFVEDFLLRNEVILTLAGSLTLICFGIYLFQKNPVKSIKHSHSNRTSTRGAVLTGYLFTFSNPLIVVLIMGLFTRFSFFETAFQIHHYVLGFVFIFAGALLWWLLVTYFVDKLRTHFNLRSIWIINKITGSIIIIFSIVGAVKAIMKLC